ncbi:MAG: DUF1223 domain-containing protein [Rubrivivax sp.]
MSNFAPRSNAAARHAQAASLLAVVLAAAAGQAAAAGPTCQASNGANVPTVVELYTSEGCSSCPPADKWLSTLKGRPDVLALAFHVDYWDRLGWADRFATHSATQRQYDLASLAGRSGVYTPQVIVGGQDWRSWPRLPAAQPAGASATTVNVSLVRDGDRVTAQVAPGEAAGKALAGRFSGYWAVLEDSYQSNVRAGENSGETLRHDHVVRQYQPVESWRVSEGLKATLQVSSGVAEHPRRVVFVVTDPATAKPLQAVVLAC